MYKAAENPFKRVRAAGFTTQDKAFVNAGVQETASRQGLTAGSYVNWDWTLSIKQTNRISIFLFFTTII